MTLLSRLAAGLALAAASALAAAQQWPAKPVRIMVGASPGGGTDIIARMLAEKYQAIFGQPFVVENRPGASNTIAADLTAKASPDGYTILVATNTAQSIAPHLLKLGYDPLKDLVPVALLVTVPNVLVVEHRRAGEEREGAGRADQGEPGQVLVRRPPAPAARSISRARRSRTSSG